MIQYNVLYSDIIQYTILNILDTTLQCSVQYITVSYNILQRNTCQYTTIYNTHTSLSPNVCNYFTKNSLHNRKQRNCISESHNSRCITGRAGIYVSWLYRKSPKYVEIDNSIFLLSITLVKFIKCDII